MSLNLPPLGQLGGIFPFYKYLYTGPHLSRRFVTLSSRCVFCIARAQIFSFRLIIQCFAGLVYIARHICTTHWLWSNLFFLFVSCSLVHPSYSHFPLLYVLYTFVYMIPYILPRPGCDRGRRATSTTTANKDNHTC